jgi:NACHT domain- and WD repeat-containing protein
LGQKYGYRPIPTYIVSAELAMLREELTAINVDGSVLDMWYKKDSNAVPPVSVLQPISSILVNFNNKVISKYLLCFSDKNLQTTNDAQFYTVEFILLC